MPQINAFVITITLDDQNYPEWAFCVQTALRGTVLLFHLTNDAPALQADGTNAIEIKDWQINHGKVISTIVNSAKKSMIMGFSKFKTAKAIWSPLKERFVQDSGALSHTLMQQTCNLADGMSIDEYYSAFDRLMCSQTSMIGDCTADDCPKHNLLRSPLYIVFSWR
jgi:hypothetical protein